MKKSIILLVTLAMAVALVGTGCKTKPRTGVTDLGSTSGGDAGSKGRRSGSDNVPPVRSLDGATSSTVHGDPDAMPDPGGLDGMTKDEAAFKANTVYFDFDRAAVGSAEHSKIDEVVQALKSQPKNKIQIEGHCDERGTEEYNRSLGERRALAIRDYMIQAGVHGSRVFTISYGKDRPAAQGHDEAAWAKNRRGEFILYRP